MVHEDTLQVVDAIPDSETVTRQTQDAYTADQITAKDAED